jgi:phosphoribosylglycinamide formyltransferase 1
VTVHLANERFDEGAIIAQRPVIVSDGETLDTLETKIHAVEHELYPEVIGRIAAGEITLGG